MARSLLTSLITGIELQNSLLVRVAEQLPGQAEDTGRLSDTGHARDDDMGHVAVLCDDLEALYRFRVSDDIV